MQLERNCIVENKDFFFRRCCCNYSWSNAFKIRITVGCTPGIDRSIFLFWFAHKKAQPLFDCSLSSFLLSSVALNASYIRWKELTPMYCNLSITTSLSQHSISMPFVILTREFVFGLITVVERLPPFSTELLMHSRSRPHTNRATSRNVRSETIKYEVSTGL